MMSFADDATWLQGMLDVADDTVGRYLPVGLARYVRIFHPAYRLCKDASAGTDADVHHGWEPVGWHEIATRAGHSLAVEMSRLGPDGRPSRFAASSMGSDAGSAVSLWDRAPTLGRLPSELGSALVSVLARHTSRTDRIFWAVWDGYAEDYPDDDIGALDLAVPRRYRVYPRTLGDVERNFARKALRQLHPPNLWWPADNAWCVSTEIDFRWTYVGGSEECIAEILADASFEAIPTSLAEGNFVVA